MVLVWFFLFVVCLEVDCWVGLVGFLVWFGFWFVLVWFLGVFLFFKEEM